MGLFDALRRALGAGQAAQAGAARPREMKEVVVAEVTAGELLAELGAARTPFLLDIREPFERRQGYILDHLHIPMNSIPARLAELPRDADIVVYCAHGNRSYSVAGWLVQQGYAARSLKGGIAGWNAAGGAVARD
ncbi:MAG: Thiosulfate sulfurtransferase GlpE [Chloroflexi bacterium ADurb.Bin325]|nr:MAG: Thiosulfate sulfurtransferase GlpE [Chloroflexi bacterium ADurb.Bin325]